MTADISSALIEQAEAETYADFEAAAPAATRAVLGTRQLRIGGGIALAMPHDPSGFWSKTLGLGFSEPVTAELLERVIDFYREQGMSAMTLPLAPRVLPPDWPDICAKLNISGPRSAWVKLVGDLRTVTASGHAARLDAGLRMATITAGEAREWAEMMWRVFGLPAEHQVEMGVGSVGRPGWRSFAVFEGSTIVAAASLHIFKDTGHLFGAATLPSARGRGAQSALIAARAVAAREAGCAWLIGETGAEGPGEHNASLHNMLRAGMTARYHRQNWAWHAPSA
jgi:GNAT superfamily N-acetyltransferase